MNIVYCKVIKNENGRYQLIDTNDNIFPLVEQLNSYIVKTAYKKHEAIRIPYTIDDDGKVMLKQDSTLLQRVSIDTYYDAIKTTLKKQNV